MMNNTSFSTSQVKDSGVEAAFQGEVLIAVDQMEFEIGHLHDCIQPLTERLHLVLRDSEPSKPEVGPIREKMNSKLGCRIDDSVVRVNRAIAKVLEIIHRLEV
jgi:hypothetical protein